MAHSEETRNLARSAYVRGRMTQAEAADHAGVSLATVRSWKRKAKAEGDDWDIARQATLMAQGGMGDMTTQILEDFAAEFQRAIQILREPEEGSEPLTPLQRADILVKLSDAYTKIMKSAANSNTAHGKLAAALEMLGELADFVQAEFPQHAEALMDIIEPFGAHLSKQHGA